MWSLPAIAWWLTLSTAWGGFLGSLVKRELRDPALDGAIVTVRVDNHRGRKLVDQQSELRLTPASTMKWITAVAATEVLGLDYVFETRLAVSGELDGSTLIGDVVFVGSGDPTLGLEDPADVLGPAVAVLGEAGITRVEGRVRVADNVVGDGPLGPGWMWDDLRFSFSAPFGSMNLGHNLPHRALRVCETVDGAGTPIRDPDRCAARALDDLLERNGIEVSGEPVVGAPPDVLTDLLRWESPPLREIMQVMLEDSDNLYAEAVARSIDQVGVKTIRGARDVYDDLLARAGVGEDGIYVADGSGLSRYSLVSAKALVKVTGYGLEQPWGHELRELLAVLGQSGTLRGRGGDSPARGRVWGKTGSMAGVRNIVGVAYDRKGRPVPFAIMFNGLTASSTVANSLQDRIMALLSVSRGRCVRRADRIAALGEDDG